ncbi:5'-nucleotidase [Minicystis rosea]|nr:5'-nucleotidase [Minicystis rosea]
MNADSIRLAAIGLLCASLGACGGHAEPYVPSCSIDTDCGDDTDPCVAHVCRSGECEMESRLGTRACECRTATDCDQTEATPCFVISCAANQCVSALAAAGPAPVQTQGDCATFLCDGQTRMPMLTQDLTDVPPDEPCGKGMCTAAGPSIEYDPDGTSCSGDAGFCFQHACVTGCVPQNASACGGEGPNEPVNDDSTTPASFTAPNACGMLDDSDVDWYTFYAKDEDFQTDILHFDAWSTAPTIELCAYARCTDGSLPSGGGCEADLDGPNGSKGCCWTGASQGFSKTWDLECTTSDDSGDIYVSIRSTTAGACAVYAVSMSY